MFSFPHKNTIYLYGLYQNVPWESEIKYPVLWYQCYTHVFLKILHVDSFVFPVLQVLNIFYKQLQQYFLNWQQSLWNMKEKKKEKYKLCHFYMTNKPKHLRKYFLSKKQTRKKRKRNKIWKQFTLFPSFIFPFDRDNNLLPKRQS